MADEPGQTDRQRRQTERRRQAKQLYDAARDAGGIERALAQLDLAAIVAEFASLTDRIRADLAQLATSMRSSSRLPRPPRSSAPLAASWKPRRA